MRETDALERNLLEARRQIEAAYGRLEDIRRHPNEKLQAAKDIETSMRLVGALSHLMTGSGKE